MSERPRHCIVAILPCNDIGVSTHLYGRLGLSVHSDHGRYRILSDGKGWLLHLSSEAPEDGWFPDAIQMAFIFNWKMLTGSPCASAT
jgi:hypothetical protein